MTVPDAPPRVLIVEDDAGNALVMRKILVKLGGMQVRVTEDGDEVLGAVARGEVDAVVMDVSLGNTRVGLEPVDGLELTRRVKDVSRRRGVPVPVLLATAHAMRGDGSRFLAACGADSYVSKPIVDHQGFASAVKTLLRVRA